MIKVTHLKKSFGDKQVIKDVSLAIEPGKTTSIVGRNGAGKSTILSMIMDYKFADDGRVEKDRLSVMPDADNLFRDMKGLYFLQFIAKLKKSDIQKVEIEALAGKLFLKNDLNKKLKSYSFGMKKKISFLQAIIGDFDSYIFDEPTSGVDIETEAVMMNMITDLKQKGKTILLTSHNMEEVERFSDYVYILDGGVISSEGTVDELTQNKGTVGNFVVLFKSQEQDKVKAFLKVQGISDPAFSDESFTLSNLSTEDIQDIVRAMSKANIEIRGFFPEKRDLREVVFQETENEDRK
jgi:ABC-2 type transport system ATP-binding protein